MTAAKPLDKAEIQSHSTGYVETEIIKLGSTDEHIGLT